ncbi:hypothetical protein KOAAANKH_01541 [Brevundimonas sp. NIBR10]|nr:hypothetical protein KOAAANKH_01541 [Brevundimonas sp. NIBR10]
MWFSQELYGSCRHEPAGLLTPCRYRAPGGRVMPLQHHPLNDPTLCARPFDGPGRRSPRKNCAGIPRSDPALHTPAATRSQGLAPFPATGRKDHSGVGDLGAWIALTERQNRSYPQARQGIGSGELRKLEALDEPTFFFSRVAGETIPGVERSETRVDGGRVKGAKKEDFPHRSWIAARSTDRFPPQAGEEDRLTGVTGTALPLDVETVGVHGGADVG